MENTEIDNVPQKKTLKKALIITSIAILVTTAVSIAYLLLKPKQTTESKIPIDYPEETEIKTNEDTALKILHTYPDVKELTKDLPKSPILTIPDNFNSNKFTFRIFPNLHRIRINPITVDSLKEEYKGENLYLSFKVDIQTETVEPYFEEVKNYEDVTGTTDVLVPGTNIMTVIPKKYGIQIEQNGEVTILGSELGVLVNNCSGYMQDRWQFCRDLFAKFDQQALDDIKKERLWVQIRYVDTELDQETWALENVNKEGVYLKDRVKEYGEDALGEYVDIGSKTFYKIKEGCCGDNSTSYIYKSSNNKLIFFRNIESDTDAFLDLLRGFYEISI